MLKSRVPFFIVPFAVFSLLSTPANSETIRDRASAYFGLAQWTTSQTLTPPIEIKGQAIPGGNETFPSLAPTGDSGIISVYPELEGLGKLDYTGIDANLLALLSRVSVSLRDRELSSPDCLPDRAFLATVSTYRLQKLPDVRSVRHSRPILEPSGDFRATFRLQCTVADGNPYGFITVTASPYADAWYVSDLTFDGESYATLAQQD